MINNISPKTILKFQPKFIPSLENIFMKITSKRDVKLGKVRGAGFICIIKDLLLYYYLVIFLNTCHAPTWKKTCESMIIN